MRCKISVELHVVGGWEKITFIVRGLLEAFAITKQENNDPTLLQFGFSILYSSVRYSTYVGLVSSQCAVPSALL